MVKKKMKMSSSSSSSSDAVRCDGMKGERERKIIKEGERVRDRE
jgi:hypothetical protein